MDLSQLMGRQAPAPIGTVIGFKGGIGCGKSASATYASFVAHGHHASFGRPLKAYVCSLFSLDESQYQTQVEKNAPITLLPERSEGIHWTFRTLCEFVGTDVCRRIDPNIWVSHTRKTMIEMGGNFMFDDLRFQNEVDMVREFNGFIIEVDVENNQEVETTGHESDEKWKDIKADFKVTAKRNDLPGLFGQIHKLLLDVAKLQSLDVSETAAAN